MKRLLLFLPLLLVGCVTTQSLPVEDRSRTYDLDYDIVFDAIVQMLAEQGFAVIDAEKDEGIINTDYRAPGDRFMSFFFGDTRMKVTALISEAPNGTRALLNLELQDVNASPDSPDYAPRGLSPRAARRYYRDFFASLNNYLPQY